jgi:hypothetical protein
MPTPAVVKKVAYYDDVAILMTTGTPSDIGASAVLGNGTHAARDNHVHTIGTAATDATTIEVSGGALRIKDGGVTSAKLATLNAAMNCGSQQLQYALCHLSSSEPTQMKQGQYYMDSDDGALYFCTVGYIP